MNRTSHPPPPEPTRGFRLGRLAGVEVHVDWSLLIIFGLVTFGLGAQMLPAWHPDWSMALRWTVALVAAVLFFASVLAHEMSHALVGRTQGIAVRRITLFLFGGMAHMENEPPSPKAEILMAAAGPIASIAIGVGAGALAGMTMSPELGDMLSSQPEAALSAMSPAQSVLLWLGPINIMLGVFNLVPGFPLDGGRVFRAVAWWATGDMMRATRWAAGVGRVFALMLITAGVGMALGLEVPFFGTGFGSGLWLVLIGWFLHKAATASYHQLVVRAALRGVTVQEIMRHGAARVTPHTTVEALMNGPVMQTDQNEFPVVDGVRLCGVVTSHDAMSLAPERWSQTPVSMIMRRADDVATVAPDGEVTEALDLLQRSRSPMIPVVHNHELRGTLHGVDVFKWLSTHMDLGAPA